MHLPHVLPFARDPLYFFTACTANRARLLNRQHVVELLRDTWIQSAVRQRWFVGRYVVMPDHVHLFARPSPDAVTRADWLKAWKSITARGVARCCDIAPPIWQSDTFDHILRSASSYSEKWSYVRENPVRAGLVKTADAWEWQGEIHSLEF